MLFLGVAADGDGVLEDEAFGEVVGQHGCLLGVLWLWCGPLAAECGCSAWLGEVLCVR